MKTATASIQQYQTQTNLPPGSLKHRIDLQAAHGAISSHLRAAAGKPIPPPKVFDGGSWPPDYGDVRAWRTRKRAELAADPKYAEAAREYYRTRPIEFIVHWCSTYDPRNIADGIPAHVPFILFPKQVDLVDFIIACFSGSGSGLVEKSRTMGATWVCVALAAWFWLFVPDFAIGFGSAKAQKVDRIGDPSTIFEKIRMLLRDLPSQFLPANFNDDEHLLNMRIINPANGSTIIGEGGDNIGRGGRTSIYFVDEAAHLEHPELIEASLSETTRCRIDVSSVSGIGTVFYRKREAGIEWARGKKISRRRTNVLVMDWSDHPAYDETWHEEKKAKHTAEGTQHLMAQEIDRDYAGAMQNVCIPQDWVRAAVDAHIKLGIKPEEQTGWFGGLDVADGGLDRNALIVRKGIVIRSAEEWVAPDTGTTTRRAVATMRKHVLDLWAIQTVELDYDVVGVGSGVKSEVNRLREGGMLPKEFKTVPWAGGATPMWPHQRISGDKRDKTGPTNREFFANLKAQAWWSLRRRFELTWRAVTLNEMPEDTDQLISLPSNLPLLRSLQKELSQAQVIQSATSMKLMIDKTPEGTKSPNLADACVISFFPWRDFRSSSGGMTFAGASVIGA